MARPETPPFYDDLEAARAEAFRRLADGVADRRSTFHTPALATIGLDGAPEVRVVVLRGFEPAALRLRVHTDARSAKPEHLRRDPRAGLLFYDPPAKIQLRVNGPMTVHQSDSVAADAWAATRDFSRRCYLGTLAPGQAVDRPTDGLDRTVADGFARFTVLRLTMRSLDWLFLSARGHRRARFTWDPDSTPASAEWLVP